MLIAAVLLLTLGGLLTWRMANEIQYTNTFNYIRGNVSFARSIIGQYVNVGSDPLTFDVMTVTTSALAIPLGGVTVGSGTWAWFRNLDPTNYVQILSGTGGKNFLYLKPGIGVFVPLGSDVTVPFAQANTASCSLEYAFFSL